MGGYYDFGSKTERRRKNARTRIQPKDIRYVEDFLNYSTCASEMDSYTYCLEEKNGSPLYECKKQWTSYVSCMVRKGKVEKKRLDILVQMQRLMAHKLRTMKR